MTGVGVALLRDLLITTKDGDWGKDEPRDGMVPYRVIRGADFPGARVGDTSGVPRCWLNGDTVARRTLQPDDILIETAGGNRDRPTGRTLLVTNRLLLSLDLPATCASFCRFLRVDPARANPRYVFWYLQYIYQRGDMWEHQVQHTGVARFQYTTFAASSRIPLPALAQQGAIAHVLGTLDDKIEVNRRMNQTLEAMGRALFKSWFVDFDPVRAKAAGRRPAGMDAATAALFPTSFVDSPMGKIPKGWECGTLRQLCDPQYGYTASAKPEGPGPKLLRVTDMNKEPWVEWEDVPHCEPDETRLSRYRLEIGDVLVSRMADPGKAAIVEEAVDAVFASYLIRLNRRWPRDSYFVFYFLRSDQYLAYAQSVTSGSVQANMNAQVITAAALLIPPPAVRQRFGDCILPLRQKIVGNLQENRQIAILRDTLLPKLLSGELCVGAIKP